jgi:hypothetical protein
MVLSGIASKGSSLCRGGFETHQHFEGLLFGELASLHHGDELLKDSMWRYPRFVVSRGVARPSCLVPWAEGGSCLQLPKATDGVFARSGEAFWRGHIGRRQAFIVDQPRHRNFQNVGYFRARARRGRCASRRISIRKCFKGWCLAFEPKQSGSCPREPGRSQGSPNSSNPVVVGGGPI